MKDTNLETTMTLAAVRINLATSKMTEFVFINAEHAQFVSGAYQTPMHVVVYDIDTCEVVSQYVSGEETELCVGATVDLSGL